LGGQFLLSPKKRGRGLFEFLRRSKTERKPSFLAQKNNYDISWKKTLDAVGETLDRTMLEPNPLI